MFDFSSELAAGPLADGALGARGRIAGQGDNLGDLFGRNADRFAGTGASVRRSGTGKSSRDTDCNTSQRPRQRRTISTLTSRWQAIWPLLAPSAAASRMRAEHELLRRGMAARALFEFLALSVRKLDDWGGWDHAWAAPPLRMGGNGWTAWLYYTMCLFRPKCTKSLSE